MSEIDAYKIFRQLEERKKRENPYKFYDKDELIDEILKLEDKLQQKENIIKEVREKLDYLLNNDMVEINGKTYIKQEADNIITNYIKEILDKGE